MCTLDSQPTRERRPVSSSVGEQNFVLETVSDTSRFVCETGGPGAGFWKRPERQTGNKIKGTQKGNKETGNARDADQCAQERSTDKVIADKAGSRPVCAEDEEPYVKWQVKEENAGRAAKEENEN